MRLGLTSLLIIIFAGFALGCMLMAVLQRRATARKEKKWRAEIETASAAKRPPAKVVDIVRREARR